MGKTKGRTELERGLADMSAPTPTDERWYPDLDAIVEEYAINMPLIGLGRLVGRQALDESNRLIEFCISAQIQLSGGEWSTVVQIDTAHTEVHIQYYSCSGKRIGRDVLLPICTINDVDRGYKVADTLIIAKWDDHEERWRHGT